MHKGSCLCGAVRIEVEGALRPAGACHCTQCRKQSGHFFASTTVPRTALTVHGSENVTWYRASDKARRGFCAVCGSWLFWDPQGEDTTEIAMGAFDAPTGTRLATHIYVAEKGDYYDLTDGLPQKARW
jgi:hypothetical protein